MTAAAATAVDGEADTRARTHTVSGTDRAMVISYACVLVAGLFTVRFSGAPLIIVIRMAAAAVNYKYYAPSEYFAVAIAPLYALRRLFTYAACMPTTTRNVRFLRRHMSPISGLYEYGRSSVNGYPLPQHVLMTARRFTLKLIFSPSENNVFLRELYNNDSVSYNIADENYKKHLDILKLYLERNVNQNCNFLNVY